MEFGRFGEGYRGLFSVVFLGTLTTNFALARRAGRALDGREDGFGHGTLAIPITVHAGVVGMIEWIHDSVFDQQFDAAFAREVTI